MTSSRLPLENSDSVSLVIALLVRFPEIASVQSQPAEGTVRFSFVVSRKLDRRSQRAAAEAVTEHVLAFLDLGADTPTTLRVSSEVDEKLTFLHVLRDVATFTKDELVMLVGLLSEHFGEALMKNPTPDEHVDDDAIEQEELVDYAIDSMRDPAQQKSLVGFREEKRVLVYFVKSRKKAKASARS